MKFVNREKELKILNDSREKSKRKLYSIAMYGLRRIGKTRLILEFLDDNDIYFFINKNKSPESLLNELSEQLRLNNIISKYEVIKNWDEFFEVIFERYNGTVVFDEFQNFEFVSKEVYGILQKYIDLYENRKNLLLIFSGSTIGLMKKIFQNNKEPLYGRIKKKIVLKQMDLKGISKMCNELEITSIEDILKFCFIFGGFPRYYVMVEDECLNMSSFEDILEELFFDEFSPIEDELNTILYQEFGGRSGIYFDILCAIANGNTTISEIASDIGRKETSITRQLNELVNYFELVGYEENMLRNKRLLYIKHPLLNFWFRFFYKYYSQYQRRDEKFKKYVFDNLNQYYGFCFERVCKKNLPRLMGRNFDKIGKYWFKEEEIDIVAIEGNDIYFGECKWKYNVNPKKVLSKLEGKIDKLNVKNKNISYILFAKNFKYKIEEFGGFKVYCYDLDDLERIMR